MVDFSNNKADFLFSDEFFYKKYFVNEKNESEAKLLQKINTLYGSKLFENDGYQYNFVRCYGVDPQGFIKMERLTGDTLANTSMKVAEKSYHAGVWLGAFHSLTNDNGTVSAFNDFTLHNIIHNTEEKKFTAFDCGGGGLKKSGLDLDILKFLFSLLMHKLRSRKIPSTMEINKFFEGYQIFGKYEFVENSFTRSSKVILKELGSSNKRSRHSLVKIIIAHFVLRFYFMKVKKIARKIS